MKELKVIAGLIIFTLFFMKARAQVKLTPPQVKEIVIHNAAGGLGGGMSADVKVFAENGEWHSYLIQKTSKQLNPERRSYDSTLHRFIAVINPQLVNHLLGGIAVIRPAITPSTFGLTAQKLIEGLKNDAKAPITQTPDFEKLITQKVIHDAIVKSVVGIDRMDDFEYCEVTIFTRHNDSVKLSTRNLCPTKLPWTFNNHFTYDMGVNNFVVAAIGNEDIPNKQALNISSLKESIYNYIDDQNPAAPIATFKWNYDYPENLKLLTEHFTITEKVLYGNEYSCWLRTKAMPANASIEGRIDMARREDINTVIEYAGLIDRHFKADNFVFKYYSNRPDSHFAFSYNTGQSPYNSLRYLSKKLPELSKADSSKTISFWLGAPDESSFWIICPDSKVLLTYHSVTTPNGETAPIYPPQDPSMSWTTKSDTWYLFDGAGKVLKQGLRF